MEGVKSSTGDSQQPVAQETDVAPAPASPATPPATPASPPATPTPTPASPPATPPATPTPTPASPPATPPATSTPTPASPPATPTPAATPTATTPAASATPPPPSPAATDSSEDMDRHSGFEARSSRSALEATPEEDHVLSEDEVDRLISRLGRGDLDAMHELCKPQAQRPSLPRQLLKSRAATDFLGRVVDGLKQLPNTKEVDAVVFLKFRHAFFLLLRIAVHPHAEADFIEKDFLERLYPFLADCHSTSLPFSLHQEAFSFLSELMNMRDEPTTYKCVIKDRLFEIFGSILKSGSRLSQTLAFRAMERALKEARVVNGCLTSNTATRAVAALNEVFNGVEKQLLSEALKRVIDCYVLLSQTRNGHRVLKERVPDELQRQTFPAPDKDAHQRLLSQLKRRLSSSSRIF